MKVSKKKIRKDKMAEANEIGEALNKKLLEIVTRAVNEADELLKDYNLETKMKICFVDKNK